MIVSNIDKMKNELKLLSKNIFNTHRRIIRQSASEIYKKSWEIVSKKYRFIRKNSKSKDGARPFSNRVKSIKTIGQYPMSFRLKLDKKPIHAIYDVRGNKNPRPQKGIPIKKRKKVTLRTLTLPDEKYKLFIARTKKNGRNVLFKRINGELKSQSVPSINRILEAEKDNYSKISTEIYLKEMNKIND